MVYKGSAQKTFDLWFTEELAWLGQEKEGWTFQKEHVVCAVPWTHEQGSGAQGRGGTRQGRHWQIQEAEGMGSKVQGAEVRNTTGKLNWYLILKKFVSCDKEFAIDLL